MDKICFTFKPVYVNAGGDKKHQKFTNALDEIFNADDIADFSFFYDPDENTIGINVGYSEEELFWVETKDLLPIKNLRDFLTNAIEEIENGNKLYNKEC